MGYAQVFPKVLLGLLNNFLQRTRRGWGLWTERIFTLLGRSDAFLQSSISVSFNLFWNSLCYCLKHSCHRYSTHRVYISTLARRKCFWLEAQESQVRVTPPQCLIEERLRANSLHKDSCTAHWWALTLSFSINVKRIFVTLMINYQYWHCDYICLHLGWKFKNRPKKQDIQLLSSVFMR